MARKVVVPLLAAALSTAACADQVPSAPDGSATASAARAPARRGAEPGRYLVGFEGRAVIPASVLAASGGRIVDSIPAFRVLTVDGVTNPKALLAARPKYVEAGFDMRIDPIVNSAPVKAAAVPNAESTPWYASGVLWGMRAIEADKGWALTGGGNGIRVCIVDTGVDADHQELVGRVVARENFVTAEPRIDDPFGHGSHVAGTVAGFGEVVIGVAPRSSIMSARVLSTAGSGSETAIVNGMNWCVENGAHIINMSLGGIRYRGTTSFVTSPVTYGLAVDNATSQGVVVVASAGNSNIEFPNSDLLVVPSQVPGVLNVGATGPLTKSTAPAAPAWNPFDPDQVWYGPDHKAYYSNFGASIDVFAPGGRGGVPLSEPYRFVDRVPQGVVHDFIWSICSSQTSQTGAENVGGVPSGSFSCLGETDLYIAYAGTSMAAPHVSGMAALLYEELGGVRSAANQARVMSCIETTTDDIGPESIYGRGRINVEKAIEALRAGQC